jgi:hypothetical protein
VDESDRGVAFGEAVVESERALGVRPRRGDGPRRRPVAVEGQEKVAVREPGIGAGETRVLADGLLEVRDPPPEGVLRPLVPLVAAAEVGEMRLGGRSMRAGRRGKAHLDLAGDAAGHVTLDRQHVAHLAVVALRPHVRLVARANELGGDTEPAVGLPHAALEDEVDPELPPDLAHALRALLVLHDGGPCDDAEVSQPAQVRDQLLGEAVAQVLAVRVSGEVGEWKDGEAERASADRWPRKLEPGHQTQGGKGSDPGQHGDPPPPTPPAESPDPTRDGDLHRHTGGALGR